MCLRDRGIMAELKIELPSRRELNSQGTKVSKADPKELPKSEQPLREVPELTFEPLARFPARFGRFWVALGTPLGRSAKSLFEPFLIRILKFEPKGSK